MYFRHEYFWLLPDLTSVNLQYQAVVYEFDGSDIWM